MVLSIEFKQAYFFCNRRMKNLRKTLLIPNKFEGKPIQDKGFYGLKLCLRLVCLSKINWFYKRLSEMRSTRIFSEMSRCTFLRSFFLKISHKPVTGYLYRARILWIKYSGYLQWIKYSGYSGIISSLWSLYALAPSKQLVGNFLTSFVFISSLCILVVFIKM